MPFDANKLYCSEVLAILLQDNDGELLIGQARLGATSAAELASGIACFLCLLSVQLLSSVKLY